MQSSHIVRNSQSVGVGFFFFWFCFVLFCFVLFCFVLFCFVLFCFVLFCFVLFCFVFCVLCFVFCFLFFVFWSRDLLMRFSSHVLDHPSAAPIPFPRFFKPHVTSAGFLDVRTPSSSTLVRSMPTFSHLQNTTHLRGWYRKMHQELNKIEWQRQEGTYQGALDRHKWGEINNEWQTLMEDYEWHGA